jgi:hypothetical protein
VLQGLLHAPLLRNYYLLGCHCKQACPISADGGFCVSCELVSRRELLWALGTGVECHRQLWSPRDCRGGYPDLTPGLETATSC